MPEARTLDHGAEKWTGSNMMAKDCLEMGGSFAKSDL